MEPLVWPAFYQYHTWLGLVCKANYHPHCNNEIYLIQSLRRLSPKHDDSLGRDSSTFDQYLESIILACTAASSVSIYKMTSPNL
jgi:hypothetical protein